MRHSQIASEEAHINDLAMAVRSLGDRFDWFVPTARPGFKYAVDAVDYFTKWAKAKPLLQFLAMYDDRLYKKGFLTPFLKFVNLEEGNHIL